MDRIDVIEGVSEPSVEEIATTIRVCRWAADKLEGIDRDSGWIARMFYDCSRNVKDLRRIAHNFERDPGLKNPKKGGGS